MKWVVYFKAQSDISIDDIKAKCLDTFSTDKYETIGSGLFKTHRFEGLSNMNRAQLEDLLIPMGLVSLIPKDIDSDEGSERKVKDKSLILSRAKEMILRNCTNKQIQNVLGFSSGYFNKHIKPLKEIWLKEK